MVFTVSIRETEELERRLKAGLKIELPKECLHNSKVIYELLGYVDRVFPGFKKASSQERKTIAGAVAYLMRTDLLILGRVAIGPIPYSQKRGAAGKGDSEISLRNSPKKLSPKWKMPNTPENSNMGAELYRCYSAAISWIPGLNDRLDPKYHSLTPAFTCADVTAFLLDPKDLDDYHYSPGEVNAFDEKLAREMERV